MGMVKVSLEICRSDIKDYHKNIITLKTFEIL